MCQRCIMLWYAQFIGRNFLLFVFCCSSLFLFLYIHIMHMLSILSVFSTLSVFAHSSPYVIILLTIVLNLIHILILTYSLHAGSVKQKLVWPQAERRFMHCRLLSCLSWFKRTCALCETLLVVCNVFACNSAHCGLAEGASANL